MILNVIIDSKQTEIDVPQHVLDEGHDFFDMMDRDMDQGWKIGPEFVENPDQEMRIQIAADKILSAIARQKTNTLNMMAGYILNRDPSVRLIQIDTSGEPLNTKIVRTD